MSRGHGADSPGEVGPSAAIAAPRLPSGSFGFLFIVLQLVLLLRVFDRYQLESLAFRRLLLLAVCGFAVHHWLRAAHRLSFFVLLSIACLPLVFGIEGGSWSPSGAFLRSAALLALASAIVWICHLGASLAQRSLLLLGLAALLAAARGGWIPVPAMGAVWPILGSMFMFRSIVYLHEMQHAKERPTLLQAAAYFLMLPNVCFPLFPVVDFKAFTRTRFNGDALQIYQKGVNWMLRGSLQLLLYRLVYYHAYIDAERIENGTDLVRHLVSNFALYLRVSGQFHLVVGMLHLFGWNLPETNRHYFLSESFTDFWRRVNIYFKDFIMKIFYYPAAFRLRRFGAIPAMLGATAICFTATWFLHAYQWFWLRGTFSLTPQDAAFWAALGLLVALNSLWEQTRGRQRSLSKQRGWRRTLPASARAAATYAAIASLWSLWSSPSWEQWLAIWSFADRGTALWGAVVLGSIALLVLANDAVSGLRERLLGVAVGAGEGFPLRAAVLGCVVPALLVYGIGGARVGRLLPASLTFVVESLKSGGLNAADLGAVERGYYENLLDVAGFNLELNQVYMNKPADWREFFDTDLWQDSHDRRFRKLAASKSERIDGKQISTNRWGMRDQDYELEKPEDVLRIAMLGSSHVFGWGVDDGKPFEALAEAKLNLGRSDGKRLESLNLGVPGYSPLCQLDTLEDLARPFHPDAVFLIAHTIDPSLNVERLARDVREGVDLREDYLRQLTARAGLRPSMPELWVRRRMVPFASEFVAWAYRRIAEIARANGAQPVWVYLPRVAEGDGSLAMKQELSSAARAAGMAIVDLDGVFDGMRIEDLAFTAWDLHPNERGHALIADLLVQRLAESPELSYLAGGLPAGAHAARAAGREAQR